MIAGYGCSEYYEGGARICTKAWLLEIALDGQQEEELKKLSKAAEAEAEAQSRKS